jgi:LemA protein
MTANSARTSRKIERRRSLKVWPEMEVWGLGERGFPKTWAVKELPGISGQLLRAHHFFCARRSHGGGDRREQPSWRLHWDRLTLVAMSASIRTVFALLLPLRAFSLSDCAKYNELVEKDQICQQQWADVETQVQRRYDLVPNLVATVKGSAAHEEKTLEGVTQARAAASSIQLTADDLEDPAKVASFQKAQDQLKGALSRLLATQEAYPDLKANAQFHDLMIELEGTENRIARAREEYNKAVGDYNGTLAQIGGQIVNKATGRPFKARVYFTASAGAEVAPKVAF